MDIKQYHKQLSVVVYYLERVQQVSKFTKNDLKPNLNFLIFFSSGQPTFSSDPKRAHVVLLYKTEDPEDPLSYRSISFTASFSRVFESVLRKQIVQNFGIISYWVNINMLLEKSILQPIDYLALLKNIIGNLVWNKLQELLSAVSFHIDGYRLPFKIPHQTNLKYTEAHSRKPFWENFVHCTDPS